MNALSVFIYISSLKDGLIGLTAVSAVVMAIIIAISFCETASGFYVIGKKTIFAWIVLLFVTIALPNQQTVALIAASELGEKAIYSTEFKELLKKAMK